MTEKELFLYELKGCGYEFRNTDWHDDWERFEDDSLNMDWEMWQASAKRDGFKLVPRKPTRQIYRAFYDAFNSANAGNTAQCFKVGYKAMLSAVEEE